MLFLFTVCVLGSALVSVSEGVDCYSCSCYTTAQYGKISCSGSNCGDAGDLYCVNNPYGCSCPVCSECGCFSTAPNGYNDVCLGHGGGCIYGEKYYCPIGCVCP